MGGSENPKDFSGRGNNPSSPSPLVETAPSSPSPLVGEGGVRGNNKTAQKFYTQEALKKANTLRKNQTDAEGLIWHFLRNRQLNGYKFRRQAPLLNYIVDFVCFEKKLIIELDGGQHNEDKNIKYDEKRSEALKKEGFRIIRFWNNDVFKNFYGVLDTIFYHLENDISPSPLVETAPSSPSPLVGEGGVRGNNTKNPSPNSPTENLTLPQGEGKTHIPPVNIDEYPAIKEHLEDIERKRANGELGEKQRKAKGLFNREDQGKTPYNLRNCAYLEEFEKEKIVYSEIVSKPQFFIDESKDFFVEATSFLITGENLKYLTACLNSKPVTFFFKSFYAGGGLGAKGYRYKKVFLEKLPIPQISPTSQQPFISLVNQILTLKEQDPQADTSHLETEIDKLVYNLYGLTHDEIKLVEGAESSENRSQMT